MLGESERKLAAQCQVCGAQLTLGEFRACGGVGHYCTAHLSAGSATKTGQTRRERRRIRRTGARTNSSRVSQSGVGEYVCKGQFASDGVIRRGKLTADHPSCLDGDVVFVCEDIGHGPGEIVTLFIKNARGRTLAERTGYVCQ